MPSAIYINANELAIARNEATTVIENQRYSEYQGPGLLPSPAVADRIFSDAQAEAAVIFDRPEYLTNLLRDTAIREPGLAREIEEAVAERIGGRRAAFQREKDRAAIARREQGDYVETEDDKDDED